MELKTYFLPLIRYWWLLVIAAVVALLSTFLVTRQQPPIYMTRSTLVIGRAVYQSNPNSNDFWLTQQLASYYADIATRQQVRAATMEALGLPWLPQYAARPLPNSQLIEIVVEDTNPLRAQAVANELASQLIQQSPTSAQSQDQAHREFVDQQLYQLESKITETQDEIAKKQEQLGDLTSARDIANAQEELNALTAKLTTLQTNYANLLANSGQGATNTLTVIEQAALPSVPVGPNKSLIILMSTIIAVIISAAAAYLLDYLDDTLKTPEDVARLVDAPIIGYLSEMGKQDEGIYVAKQPRSVIAEAFRSLRINLEFMGVDRPLKTILITSAGMGDGKTSVASNLAVVMAQGGKRVILLDADLRRPKLHKTFGLMNEQGLSDIFRGQADLSSVTNAWDKNLSVVTGGSPPPNPADLLGSKKMNAILETLEDQADIVIVDGPPLIVADAVVLSAKVDGVLMVTRYSYTRKDTLKKSMESLTRAGARILGVTMNSMPRTPEDYYGRYRYYTAPESAGDEGEGNGMSGEAAFRNGKGRLPWLQKLLGLPGKGTKQGAKAADIEDAPRGGI